MSCSVIVAGAGPVGLFLATELALRGIRVLVLEKSSDPHAPMKAGWMGMRGLNIPSVEAFHRRGLLDEVRLAALDWDAEDAPHAKTGEPEAAKRNAGHFAGIPVEVCRDDAPAPQYATHGPSSTTGIISLEDLESLLGRRAMSLGVQIRRDCEVTAVRQDDHGVAVLAASEVHRADWLVGCDGARSIVRKRAGFDFEGTEPQFTGYLASVEMADPEKLLPGFNITPHGLYAVGPGPGRITVMDFDGGTFNRSQDITIAHLQTVLRRVSETDVTLSRIHFASTYTDRARQATTYRRGRILLAGDAAHIHSPLGAQGLNTGLIDALNLGWKLAATIQGSAPAGLLDTYTAERHPAGAWALEWTRAQVAILRPDPWSRAIGAVIRDLIATRDGAAYFAAKVDGSQRRHDLPGRHPLVGHSAPDLVLSDGSRLAAFMRGGSALLVTLHDEPALRSMDEEYPGRLTIVHGNGVDAMGLAALFIRPDGIVAWARDQDEPFEQAALLESMHRWLGRPDGTACSIPA